MEKIIVKLKGQGPLFPHIVIFLARNNPARAYQERTERNQRQAQGAILSHTSTS